MGFVLSVVYIVTYYLTPAALFGPLAAYRVQLILGILLLFLSLPRLVRSSALKRVQTLAITGLACCAFLSVLIGESWPGGAVQAFMSFLPNALAFFFVCLHCTTRRRLQVLTLTLLFVCLFVIAHGAMDLKEGVPEADPRGPSPTGLGVGSWNELHPYLFAMRNNAGEWFFRLRGLGPINDPNDFAQLEVCAIPLMFMFWRPRRKLRNLLVVILPISMLLGGIYLTHSRGALLALMALVILVSRSRIGTIPAVAMGGVLFVAAMALHFTGGRDISADAGADRTALWGEGLGILKAHPLFGVGFGRMAEHVVQTAHNSIVVCAAETGTIGLWFWSLFLFATLRNIWRISSFKPVAEPTSTAIQDFRPHPEPAERMRPQELQSTGRLILLSLAGFLITGWFLSRAFVLTLFLLGGIVDAIYEMAISRGLVPSQVRVGRDLGIAAGVAVSLVMVMYCMVRVLNMAR